jgi:hypothetical protein
MVLADSGRIARVPPYLGTPLGRLPISATGLSPSVARLSRRLAYKVSVLNAVPLPRTSFLGRFGLLRFRSPLLAESRLFSFPRGTEMFHFPRFARSHLLIQCDVRRHYPPWVSPFGYRRIKAWLAAPRRFSQLPTSFLASCRLGIHRVPFVAWSSLFLTSTSTLKETKVQRAPSTPAFLSTAYLRICNCQRTRTRTWWSRSGSNRRHPACKAGALPAELRPPAVGLVGLDRFELSTPRLSSVCSNQLSYRPLIAPLPSSSKEPKASTSPPGPSKPKSKTHVVTRDRFRQRLTCALLLLRERKLLRKEVIQPQVPLRLPCYDFTPVTSHSLRTCSPCGLARPFLEQLTPMV